MKLKKFIATMIIAFALMTATAFAQDQSYPNKKHPPAPPVLTPRDRIIITYRMLSRWLWLRGNIL